MSCFECPNGLECTGPAPGKGCKKYDTIREAFMHKCATCRFSVFFVMGNGECRRHSPSPKGFPRVCRHYWCGDWRDDEGCDKQPSGPADEEKGAKTE